ncbi:Vanadate resistance protein [Spathaspora sp. JA1]|nr:Vanadate resistance protein [Spathaspora sp. JA1]
MSSILHSRSKRMQSLIVILLVSIVGFTVTYRQYHQDSSYSAASFSEAFKQTVLPLHGEAPPAVPGVTGHDSTAAAPASESAPIHAYHKVEHTDKSYQISTVVYEKNTPSDLENKNSVIILSSIGNDRSYGNDRDFRKFLEVVNHIVKVKDTSKYEFSLGIQCNDETEYSNIKSIIASKQEELYSILSRITLVSAPFLEHQVGLTRENRHEDRLQRVRRRLIAKSRNFLWSTALKNEQYIFFMDADMISMTDHIVDHFVDSGKDVVVPRVATNGGNPDYDKNSWRGQRTKPNQQQLDLMDSNKWDEWDYTPFDVKHHIFHFETYLQDETAVQEHKAETNYIVPLDSVGGAVLFAKSIVFKQGAIFPTSNIIGTSWDRSEGYDGIETEGLCYLAKPLGFSCWGMPNIVAVHV